MERDGNHALQSKAIGVVISTFETLPEPSSREANTGSLTMVHGLLEVL
jgi:hypothetical protein